VFFIAFSFCLLNTYLKRSGELKQSQRDDPAGFPENPYCIAGGSPHGRGYGIKVRYRALSLWAVSRPGILSDTVGSIEGIMRHTPRRGIPA
ncbi:MAG: hypothetical protein LBT92_02170, partial [Rickettsiales bacterium]|nr:hypothetical protein [Rickettsiales bacterium]